MKIEFDKYYTNPELAKQLIKKTFEILENENITEIIEPSAGNGSFSNHISCIAYDIKPENENIIQQDFLTLELEYKKGRLFIGNPPFGNKSELLEKFIRKSIKLGDYIAFIMPISQYKNNYKFYQFDLIYSENLGKINYSNKNLHCCFNIFKRPEKGLNSKPIYKSSLIKTIDVRNNNKEIVDYDFAICSWGSAAGKLADKNQYAKMIYIKILEKTLYEEIKNTIINLDWEEEFSHISTRNIPVWRIHKLILKKFGS